MLRWTERWRFEGIVEPLPEFSVGKKIHAQQSDEPGKVPAEGGAEAADRDHQYGQQCCPNLDRERVGAGADEGFDAQALFDGAEEDLDLPAFAVDRRQRGGPQGEVIGEQHDLLAGAIAHHHAAQNNRTGHRSWAYSEGRVISWSVTMADRSGRIFSVTTV